MHVFDSNRWPILTGHIGCRDSSVIVGWAGLSIAQSNVDSLLSLQRTHGVSAEMPDMLG